MISQTQGAFDHIINARIGEACPIPAPTLTRIEAEIDELIGANAEEEAILARLLQIVRETPEVAQVYRDRAIMALIASELLGLGARYDPETDDWLLPEDG